MNFKEGQIEDVIIEKIVIHSDQRGWLAEFFRQDEIPKEILPVMGYVSLTHPGIARGPHEHLGQWDYFVFLGPSVFEVYLWDNRKDSPTYQNRIKITAGEDHPCKIAVPPGVVHAYKNIGDRDGIVYNFPNQLYAGFGKKEKVDEIRWENQQDSPFIIDT